MKRRRIFVDDDGVRELDAKRPKHSHIVRQPISGSPHSKKNWIVNWLSESCWSRKADQGRLFQQVSHNMPLPGEALPSPDTSRGSSASSKKTEKSVASVYDANYRDMLGYYRIYIKTTDPSAQLMLRAREITSRQRESPEIDDATAKDLRVTARKLENEAEDVIGQQLAPKIIPALSQVPDCRLALNSDQPWFNAIPVPISRDVLIKTLPLPKPKPDHAFGYSPSAFNGRQLGTIDLLGEGPSKRSYVVPDRKLRFPFLDLELKSQAKNGTHYIGTSQAAGAGAIALNGILELIQRAFGVETFDFEEPQFFSVTLDHQLACVNVHWISKATDEEQCSFHVEELSTHALSDANSLRAFQRAVKNILEHGRDVLLPTICDALDAYRGKVISEREAVSRETEPQHFQTQPNLERQRSARNAQTPPRRQRMRQREQDLHEEETASVAAKENQPPEDSPPVQRRSQRKKTKRAP